MVSVFNWKNNCWLKCQISTADQLSFKPVVPNVDADIKLAQCNDF